MTATPAQIRAKIFERIHEDFQENNGNNGEPIIPVRIYSLIDGAVKSANQEADAAKEAAHVGA
jgi:hypothetical protein